MGKPDPTKKSHELLTNANSVHVPNSQNSDSDESAQELNDPIIGTILANQYRIDEVLGTGGWSTVYRATQLNLGERVAVKVLHSGLVDKDSAFKRIEQEAKILSRIDNQYVVRIVDYGSANNSQFIVMDYFEAVPLSKYLKLNGRFATDTGIELLQQLCDGLDGAHKLGLIHRDIKPDNILLKSGTELQAKIIDFGIAKMIEESSAELTKSGELLGSPPYMAPEQWSKETIDKSVDIYALGCVAYEIFSGKKVFTANHTYEYLRLHINEDPKPFPLSLKISRNLQRIIYKCLQKDPKDRYQNAAELKNDLIKFRNGDKLSIRLQRSRRQRTKKRFIISAVALSLIACLALLVMANRRSVLIPFCAWENSTGDRLLKARNVSQAIPHYRNVVFVSKYLDKQEPVSLHAMRMLAKALRATGAFTEAAALENKVFEAIGATVNPLNQAKLSDEIHLQFKSLADQEHARKRARDQMRQAAMTIGTHTMAYSDGLMALSMLADYHNHEQSLADMRASIKIAEDLLEPDDLSIADRYINLGQSLGNLNQFAEAKSALARGLEIAKKANSAPLVAGALGSMATIELRNHNPQKAWQLISFAENYCRQHLNRDNAQILFIKSWALKELGDDDKYIETALKALKAADDQGQHFLTVLTSREIGLKYCELQRYAEAKYFLQMSLKYAKEYDPKGADNAVKSTEKLIQTIDNEVLNKKKKKKSPG